MFKHLVSSFPRRAEAFIATTGTKSPSDFRTLNEQVSTNFWTYSVRAPFTVFTTWHLFVVTQHELVAAEECCQSWASWIKYLWVNVLITEKENESIYNSALTHFLGKIQTKWKVVYLIAHEYCLCCQSPQKECSSQWDLSELKLWIVTLRCEFPVAWRMKYDRIQTVCFPPLHQGNPT